MSQEHGGDIYNFAKELACGVDEVIDLSSNINFLTPKIDMDLKDIDLAPYPDYTTLYENLAKRYGVKVEQIELFNGATSAIDALFYILKPSRVTLYAPIYLEYKRSSQKYDYRCELINRFENLYQDVTKDSLVVFVNPSTPDGVYYDLDRLMRRWKELNCTILVDESFLDFSYGESALRYLNEYPKLYILKSMTKIYSCAGVRIGAVVSQKENIKRVSSTQPLWRLSAFDSYYLQKALKDSEFIEKSRQINDSQKRLFIELLEKFPFIEEVLPSFANFILVKLKNIDAKEFQEALKEYKILIRDCSNFDFLDKHYVRIAIKSDRALKRLEEALCTISF